MPDATSAMIVVPDELASTGPGIMAIANAIGDELAHLQSMLAPLHEFWSGSSNLSWAELQSQWSQAAGDLMAAPGALGAIAATVNTNWENYVLTESANTKTWQH